MQRREDYDAADGDCTRVLVCGAKVHAVGRLTLAGCRFFGVACQALNLCSQLGSLALAALGVGPCLCPNMSVFFGWGRHPAACSQFRLCMRRLTTAVSRQHPKWILHEAIHYLLGHRARQFFGIWCDACSSVGTEVLEGSASLS